ncbi:MAG: nucleotidyl transferase AbiEii/AbiGii toxin family protein [Pseudobdellovibrionaceae bacterium]
MNKFENLPDEDKGSSLKIASEKLVRSTFIIEKDYWVCWLLGQLFALPKIKDDLTFKGGTSLSKVYSVIERFSEDIDISIEKSYLGFEGDNDPEKMGTKKRNESLKKLTEACQQFVAGELLSALNKKIKTEIGKQSWKLTLDPDDPDQQTILFFYPVALNQKSEYIRPSIKIEIGARSEHWPTSLLQISSDLKVALPDFIEESPITVKVLKIERTFWEKATILHMYAHYPSDKKVPIRQSRHYYDFYCLLKSSHKEQAEKQSDLLIRVAEHKSIYFRAGWASYETAKIGSLKLIPSEKVLADMESDFEKMAEMFFTEPPSWKEIMTQIRAFETKFNKPTN